MRKRRQAAAFLLFPILTAFFMFGWLLSIIGEPRKGKNETLLRKTKAQEKQVPIEEYHIEMGLMDQIAAE